MEDDGITNVSMQVPLTPSLEVIENITTILRLLLTQEVSGLDRLLLIDQLEQILQSLLTGTDTVNVEYDTEENGERTLTITTTSACFRWALHFHA